MFGNRPLLGTAMDGTAVRPRRIMAWLSLSTRRVATPPRDDVGLPTPAPRAGEGLPASPIAEVGEEEHAGIMAPRGMEDAIGPSRRCGSLLAWMMNILGGGDLTIPKWP